MLDLARLNPGEMMVELNRIYNEDALAFLRRIPENIVQCCVTSPPYWGLRDYGVDGQLGLEKTPEEYVTKMVVIFREVRRVLRDDGTLWLNLGDSYAGSGEGAGGTYELSTKQNSNRGSHYEKDDGIKRTFDAGLKPKNLVGIPWRVAFALQADGWYLRQDIIWAKPNPMPESVTDRCTKSHEYIFMLTKSGRYYYDAEAVKEPGSLSSIARLSQEVENQEGSSRVPAKTNGKMKAVGKLDKQRGHSRRHAGFNERWDAMGKEEQCSLMRNKRDVWNVATKPFSGAHFATFPHEIPQTCILAGTKKGDVVLDPFMGAGTTAVVAEHRDRQWIGSELNPAYCLIAQKRIDAERAQMKLAL